MIPPSTASPALSASSVRGRDLLSVLHGNLVGAVHACDAIYTRVETKTYAVATQPLLYTLAYLLTEPRLLGR